MVTNASASKRGGVTPGGALREQFGGVEVQREHGTTAGNGADADEGAA